MNTQDLLTLAFDASFFIGAAIIAANEVNRLVNKLTAKGIRQTDLFVSEVSNLMTDIFQVEDEAFMAVIQAESLEQSWKEANEEARLEALEDVELEQTVNDTNTLVEEPSSQLSVIIKQASSYGLGSLDDEELRLLAQHLKVRSVSRRWKRSTLLSKIEEVY